MGSSCVDLSRAVAAARRPGSAAVIGRAHGRSVVALSSTTSRSGAVACGVTNGYLLGSSGGSRSSLTLHGKSSGPGSAMADHADGLGIEEFLGGKNFLVTGGTGFLAKVLIEKILRTNPDVGKIYVLIKAKDSETALKRLQNEVVDTELFKCLQEIHGKDYHNFVATKLVPVVGDVREANIGIAPELADEIAERVDIIVNSAANTTFDERYDVAMDINTVGPFRIMSFAHRFRRLKLFLQVSTAYVNGQRQGVVLEKPFRLGDTIVGSSDSSEHKNTVLDVEAEIKLAFDSRRHSDDSASFSQEMKDLGLERAKLHGWQDTYVFTKAMGEMVINSMRGEIPVVTIRPSVIESTWRDPFPGWMEGNRMMDPVVLYYGKGQLSGFLADPDGVLDVVPADMVVNATLASMAKHGRAASSEAGAAGMHVYHVASSTVNPLVFGDLSRFLFQHFTRCPYSDAAGQPIHVPPMRLFDTMEQFASYVETDALLRSASARAGGAGERLSQRLQELCAKSVEQTIHLGSIYQPYTFYTGRFDNGNTEGLMAEMSPEEKARFHFNVRSIDWTDYITNVHIPGLRKHVMKGRGVATAVANPLLAAAGASL